MRKPGCNAFKNVRLIHKAYIDSLSECKRKMFHVIFVRKEASCVLFMVFINNK